MTWLAELRREKGLTQEQVAAECGLTRSSFGNIETACRAPSVKTAKKIAAALGFPWQRFYEEV